MYARLVPVAQGSSGGSSGRRGRARRPRRSSSAASGMFRRNGAGSRLISALVWSKGGVMIDLYAAPTSNSMRARMALEECGLTYPFHPVALEKGEHKTPQFLALNPNAQVPVIVDHEGPGGKPLTLSQSSAILVYCAEKSGRFIPKEGAARVAMWQALMSASTD